MQVAIKCRVSDDWDGANIAVIDVTPALIKDLQQKFAATREASERDPDFEELSFRDYTPDFVQLDPSNHWDDGYEALDPGWASLVLPPEGCEFEGQMRVGYCHLKISNFSERIIGFSWEAVEKHSEARIETYTLTEDDVREWAKMGRYTVEVSEIWKRTYSIIADPNTVTAESLRAAANKMSGEGADDVGFEYTDTLEPEHWTVRDSKGNYLE